MVRLQWRVNAFFVPPKSVFAVRTLKRFCSHSRFGPKAKIHLWFFSSRSIFSSFSCLKSLKHRSHFSSPLTFIIMRQLLAGVSQGSCSRVSRRNDHENWKQETTKGSHTRTVQEQQEKFMNVQSVRHAPSFQLLRKNKLYPDFWFKKSISKSWTKNVFLAQCAILIFFSTLKAHIPCLFITLNDFAFVLSIFVHVQYFVPSCSMSDHARLFFPQRVHQPN